MASTDARPVPQKNVAYRVTFPILDADGDLVTGATGLDSEISKDAGTFADCTNEATEIATASGMYTLDLTSTEMNADCVCIIVKTSSSGAKTTPIILYPEEAGDIRVNVTAYGGTAGTFSGGRPEVNTTHAAGTAWGSGAITAVSIATDALTAAKFATDAGTEFASAVWDLATTGHTTASTFGAQLKTLLDTIATYLDTEIAAIKAKTDNLPSDPADASDIAASFATVNTKLDTIDDFLDTEIASLITKVDTIDDFLDTEIAAIKAKTDNLPAAPAAVSDIPTAAVIADAVWDEATSGHVTGGSTGAAIIAAGSAGDPWSTSLPGAYGVGTAGKIIGDNINATISSRATQTSVDTIDDFLDTEIAAIKTQTDKLTFTVANDLDVNVQSWKDATAPAMTGDAFARLGAPAGASVSADVAAVNAKTSALPSDPADASVIAGRFDTLDTAVSPISSINTNVGTILTDTGLIKGYLDTEIAAIKAQTDLIPSDPADASDIAALLSPIGTRVGEIWQNSGLDNTKPVTITPTSRASTGISIGLSGDGITEKVLTRS